MEQQNKLLHDLLDKEKQSQEQPRLQREQPPGQPDQIGHGDVERQEDAGGQIGEPVGVHVQAGAVPEGHRREMDDADGDVGEVDHEDSEDTEDFEDAEDIQDANEGRVGEHAQVPGQEHRPPHPHLPLLHHQGDHDQPGRAGQVQDQDHVEHPQPQGQPQEEGRHDHDQHGQGGQVQDRVGQQQHPAQPVPVLRLHRQQQQQPLLHQQQQLGLPRDQQPQQPQHQDDHHQEQQQQEQLGIGQGHCQSFETSHGKRKLEVGGFYFNYQKKSKLDDTLQHWNCEKRNKRLMNTFM